MHLREQLVRASLEWESYFGVAPSITAAISELDAALLVGMDEDDYCLGGRGRTSVTKDTDFVFKGIGYQVTANRPSGKNGSQVTWVKQKTEAKRLFGWDRLIWILYDRFYVIEESWEFTADEYRNKFGLARRLGPEHMRQGRCLYMRIQTETLPKIG
jgi:hypothetical protein